MLRTSRMKITEIKRKTVPLLKKHGVVKAGIFGSYARGEAKKNSDLDILIKFKAGKGYFDLVRLERELKAKLNKKVDLITYRSINHLLKERILKDEVKLI